MMAAAKPPVRRGEAHGGAKLTEAQVSEIRRLWATKSYKRNELAAMFGVSRQTIWAILSGRHWSHSFEGKTGHSIRLGEGHVGHKLTEAKVIEIRGRLAAGETGDSLALEFGVSRSVISEIRNRKAWRHV